MEQQARKTFLINFLYFLTVFALVFIVFRFMLGYLMPFIIGAVIAWAVQKPAGFIAKKTRLKSSLCAAVLAAAVFLAAAALCTAAVYFIINSAGRFLADALSYVQPAAEFLQKLGNRLDSFFSGMPEDFVSAAESMLKNALNGLSERLTETLSGFAGVIVGNAPGFLISCIVAVVSSCYIAADYPGLLKFFRSMCGSRIYGNILRIKLIFTKSIFSFVKGYLLLMLITFAELAVGFYILGLKNALFLALLIAFIDILPVLGTGTVLIPWAVIELIMRNMYIGIGIIVLYAVITIIRNFAEPKIIGGQIGINPLFTLLAMFIGIKLFGFIGMFILPMTLIVIFKYYKEEMEKENTAF